MNTQIKICGLTREHDVDTAIHAGADAIGFVLYAPSARAVTLQRAAELARRLPPFVTPVLLFVNESIDGVQRALNAIPGAVAQFHGDESPQTCTGSAHPIGRRYLKAARIPLGPAGKDFDLVKFCHFHHQADAILLDAHVDGFGGGGKAFDWSLLPLNVNAHLVLSGGLTPANVIDGILNVRPRCRSLAVDVSSGVEVAKGIKSPALIHSFISAVRQADSMPH